MGRPPLVRHQQAWGRAQEAACANDSQDDKPNVLSSVTNEGPTSHSFQQLSIPEPLDQNPGKKLLETLRPLAETNTEVEYFQSQLSLVSCELSSALAVIRHLDE